MTLLVEATASAVIDRGTTTNRVRMRRKRKPSKRKPARWRKRAELDSAGAVEVCVSLTKADRDEIDAIAARVQMSRSQWLRQASRHFAASREEDLARARQATVGITMPAADRDAMDRARGGMSRSRWLREASKYFAGKVLP